MNELLFFSHVVILLFFLMVSLKMGKTALIVFICMQTVLANLFVTKQMELFSFTVTCSDVYAVSAIFGLNILQEYFGKEIAKKTIYLSFVFLFLFMIVSKIHLLYVPSIVDTTHSSFNVILKNTPRIVIASLSVFFLVQSFDVNFYGFLKKKYKKNSFLIRIGTSSIISQLLDTVLFSFFGLYGIVDNIYDIMIVSFFVKFLTVISCGLFVFFTNKFFKVRVQS